MFKLIDKYKSLEELEGGLSPQQRGQVFNGLVGAGPQCTWA